MEALPLLPLTPLFQPWLGNMMGVSLNGKEKRVFQEGRAKYAKTLVGKELGVRLWEEQRGQGGCVSGARKMVAQTMWPLGGY